jgi:transposase
MDGKQVEVAVPGNLPAPTEGAEELVVGKERWQEVCRLRAENWSVSEIARLTGLDRKTVRSCLRKSQWQPYRRAAAADTLLSPHAAWLAERAPQVHFSARILFQELCADRGYTGGYDTVKIAVRPLRAEATVASITQCRFETEPGEQAQADWGEAKVRFESGRAKVHIFVMTLGFSRRAWAEGYENERLSALMAAHEHAFERFGGATAEILYDRMRTVSSGVVEGKPKFNQTFEAFANHWGFEPRLCRPYRAQTKGKVESGVKYVKRNFLPGRTFRDLEDFNEQLRAWLTDVADVRIHGTTHERPIDRFAREAGALLQTRGHPSFLEAMRRSRIVADDWLVAIDSNRYSVPWRLIGKTVEVVRVGAHWHILHGAELVAEHAVLTGRHQVSINPEHAPGAAARNARRRYSSGPHGRGSAHGLHAVEVRDLAVYEQMLEAA